MFLPYSDIVKYATVDRFGSFEEFKKRMVGSDGTLNAHQRLICGLGKFYFSNETCIFCCKLQLEHQIL